MEEGSAPHHPVETACKAYLYRDDWGCRSALSAREEVWARRGRQRGALGKARPGWQRNTYASEKRLGISDKTQRSPRIPPYTNAIVGRNALVLHSGKDTGPFPFDTTRAYENRAEEPTDCSVRFGNDVMDQQSRLGSVHHRIIATRHSILKEIARMQNLRGS
jgi:hypothetical protein